ncbi:hypothetical protein KEJ49_01110 [Candidatus Bathyarchaeota archaeon]|nr:hypothetical protein [Candidatus Bathyarchaeota archaeon]
MERVRGERGLLERIMSRVPGYRGYKEKELRRESDRLVRMEAVGRLKASKEILRRRLANPMMVGRLSTEDAWRLETLSARLDRVTQRIERAAAGYAGFFDAVKVREDKLEMVLQHDLNLVEMAERVRAEMERASEVETGTEDWRKAMDGLMKRVEELDALIDRRGEILRGLEI